MSYTLGVDIGTYETKGVLVDAEGRMVAQAARAHEMIVPRPGWAEHRAEEDWWGDFVHVTRALLAESGVDPTAIGGVACSAIGPCMLPVDAKGRPLMNGVLYGVVTRFGTAEITAVFRERHHFRPEHPIHLRPDPAQLHLFDAGTGRRMG